MLSNNGGTILSVIYFVICNKILMNNNNKVQLNTKNWLYKFWENQKEQNLVLWHNMKTFKLHIYK